MKQFRQTLLMLLMCSIGETALAQSMYQAKQYYEQGQYLEAAKQLRPLADGGNAEAQTMAAKLFFEGKGVAKNDAQGIKYATLAADQGHTEAIEMLVSYYANKEDKGTFAIARKYADKHPYLKKGNVGIIMADCLMKGRSGAQKDEDAAWEILEQNDAFIKDYLKDEKTAKAYWEHNARKVCKSTIDELEEYYYENGLYNKCRDVGNYLNSLYNTPDLLKERADSGSVWAMYNLALTYKVRGDKVEALAWARKASTAGSKRANNLVSELTYVPHTYTNISVEKQKSLLYRIESIVLDYNRITINYVFRNNGYIAWIANGKENYIRFNNSAQSYKLQSSTLPTLPQTKSVSFSEVVRFSNTYYRIPGRPSPFDIIEGNEVMYKGVNILDY